MSEIPWGPCGCGHSSTQHILYERLHESDLTARWALGGCFLCACTNYEERSPDAHLGAIE